MLVVIGSPAGRLAAVGVQAAGLAAAVARGAAVGGAVVQLVGRVGDDPIGDEVLLDLAASGIEHVALLRAAGQATPLAGDAKDVAADEDLAQAAALGDKSANEADPPATATSDGLPLDAGDLDLALRYLPDYRVLVVATSLDAAAWATVIGAASWSGAPIVALVAAGSDPASLPADATILERPADDEDGSFAAMVGRYAAALDAGTEPAAAFANASSGAGWASVSD